MQPNVEGYDNYHVTRKGEVFNLDWDYKLTPRINNFGYARVSLRKSGKNKEFLVHRLVASAYIPNPENLATVDHINGDKLYNEAENLQWLSLLDNLKKRRFAKYT